jgi:hypothetical protein
MSWFSLPIFLLLLASLSRARFPFPSLGYPSLLFPLLPSLSHPLFLLAFVLRPQVGPEAAEIVQGLGIALKCNATKAQFDSCVGVHPSAAEEWVTMTSATR